MSLEQIELLSEHDRQAYADFLALELMKPIPPAHRPNDHARPSLLPLVPPKWEPFKAVEKPRRTTKHGTVSGYNAGCKCDECRAAKATYQRNSSNMRHQKVASQRKQRERVAPFVPLPKQAPVSSPFERSSISSLDGARERAAEAI